MLVCVDYVCKVSNGQSGTNAEDSKKYSVISSVLHIITSIEGRSARLGEQ